MGARNLKGADRQQKRWRFLLFILPPHVDLPVQKRLLHRIVISFTKNPQSKWVTAYIAKCVVSKFSAEVRGWHAMSAKDLKPAKVPGWWTAEELKGQLTPHAWQALVDYASLRGVHLDKRPTFPLSAHFLDAFFIETGT